MPSRSPSRGQPINISPDIFSKAESSLKMAENALTRKANRKEIASTARQAVQFSEDARALAVQKQTEERIENERLAAAAKAKAEAEDERAAAAAQAKAEAPLSGRGSRKSQSGSRGESGCRRRAGQIGGRGQSRGGDCRGEAQG